MPVFNKTNKKLLILGLRDFEIFCGLPLASMVSRSETAEQRSFAAAAVSPNRCVKQIPASAIPKSQNPAIPKSPMLCPLPRRFAA